MGDKVDAEIERILAEADKDGDGQIDYNEFVEVRGQAGCLGAWVAQSRPQLCWRPEVAAPHSQPVVPRLCSCCAELSPALPPAADDQGAGEEGAGHEAVQHARPAQLL